MTRARVNASNGYGRLPVSNRRTERGGRRSIVQLSDDETEKIVPRSPVKQKRLKQTVVCALLSAHGKTCFVCATLLYHISL